ncbi:MAG: SIS domain-containing protein [Actinobacteria bacterium]|nr:SIS domain-containing protein [Actinomycetota bacterium]
MVVKDYYESVKKILDKIYQTQLNNIIKSADIITQSIANNGAVYVFGATHAGIISEELFFRAGGLMLVNPIFAPGLVTTVRPIAITSKIENLEGYGKIIIEGSGITNKDVLIVHSVSGRNSVAIEVAIEGKKIRAKLIILTSLTFSKSVKSRHSSGKRLFELDSDVVIDNCGIIGDAIVKINGLRQKTASTSTISGCFIVNSIMAQVVENLVKKNITPPVFISANIDGSTEQNQKLLEGYKDRVRYL